MPIIVELKENRPGYANIEIKRWKGNADLEIAVQRNQDQHYFAQGEQWNSEPVWHKVGDLVDTGEALQGTLGPWLVDALVQQVGNTQYLLWAKSGDVTDRGVIRFLGNILASSAGGDSSREDDVREVIDTPTENVAVEDPIIPEIVPEPLPEAQISEPQPAEPIPENPPVAISESPDPIKDKQKKSPIGLIILLILLLALIGGIAWWLLNKPEEVAKKSPEVTACEIQAGGDELAFIQGCLKTNPDTKQLLTIIENAKTAKACGIAQRLYANKAESGNAEIAFAYAKEYDAAFSKGDGCFKLDKDTAMYWYETGLSADPNNAEAKKRLDELKK